ncbi:MAG: DUF1926 domain-containing protein [Calditrichaceae bacterium]|nr:DUF1926 domain-containing protein [Calditrichaceae bacterium]RQV93075.1 MAG: DUF1926 domain-containing protein [Calditrichota bacterium]
MKKVNFLFGIHNHQPVGNFDFVFEEAYQKSYLPFIEALERHPKIRIAIHFTGILLDWIKEKHPNYIPRVREMVHKNQVEILTGGFYEPILAVIPRNDRLGQIRKLTKMVKELFDYDAIGMWLAERIWEPTLPSTLAEAGIKYTILDDTHFKYAGLREENLHGYYMTEDLGNAVDLFPISKRLRYAIPFEDPQETINHLGFWASEEGNNIVVFADDGEKFGVWPKTYDHVYKNGWLENFLTKLEENLSWINILHFKETIESMKPLGRIYLPTASYAEMGEWSLFSKASEEFVNFEHYLMDNGKYEENNVFVRGGFWRNFLAKYREVNDMHKKVLRVSKKLWTLPDSQKTKSQKAFDHLWAAQCNCPYWHGVFGGIYLSHIRDAIYSNLIDAEKELDKLNRYSLPNIEIFDVNIDGFDEVLVETKHINAYFDSKAGGILYELDYKPLSKNILDTMTRRHEAYHSKLDRATAPGEQSDHTASIHDLVLAKEANLKSKLHYDFYDRKALIDHFIDPGVTIKDFSESRYTEKGDFINKLYTVTSFKSDKKSANVVFSRLGNVDGRQVLLSKAITINNADGIIAIDYQLQNKSSEPVKSRFGIEFNFGLQAGHADDRYYYTNGPRLDDKYLDSVGEIENTKFIGLRDDWRKLDIQLTTAQNATIWRFPIETTSLSEGGFERVYQSSVVLVFWDLKIEKNWQNNLKLIFSKIE